MSSLCMYFCLRKTSYCTHSLTKVGAATGDPLSPSSLLPDAVMMSDYLQPAYGPATTMRFDTKVRLVSTETISP